MRPRDIPLGGALLLALLCGDGAGACSTFCLRDGESVVFGKNYDWNQGQGLLVVNQRGAQRVSTTTGNPARWESRFGSVTFNQYGRDFPSGGMNEAGLVVELMWLDGSRYPRPDARPSVGNLEWIQFQLDRHDTIQAVLASDRQVRVTGDAPLHYLVADRLGGVATIEFLDGKLVAHHGDALAVPALTNSRYDASLAFLAPGTAGPGRRTAGPGSLQRFARLADRIERFQAEPAADSVAYAFETLRDVSQGASTQWSIVYESRRRGRVHFRTAGRPEISTLDLARLGFACGADPVLVLDLQTAPGGDVRDALTPYTRERNLELLRASYSGTPFLADTPDEAIVRQARHPESATCRR